MDLIGPTQIESIGGKKYVFVEVDDFSDLHRLILFVKNLTFFLYFKPYV